MAKAGAAVGAGGAVFSFGSAGARARLVVRAIKVIAIEVTIAVVVCKVGTEIAFRRWVRPAIQGAVALALRTGTVAVSAHPRNHIPLPVRPGPEPKLSWSP